MVGPEFKEFKIRLLTCPLDEQQLTLCLVLMRFVPQLCGYLEIGTSGSAKAKHDAIRHGLIIIWAVWAKSAGLETAHAGIERRAEELAEMLGRALLKGYFPAELQKLLSCIHRMPTAKHGFANLIRDALEAVRAFTSQGLSAANWNLDLLVRGASLTDVAAGPLWPPASVETVEGSWEAGKVKFESESADTAFAVWSKRLDRRLSGKEPEQPTDFPVTETWTGNTKDPSAAVGPIDAAAEAAANDNLEPPDEE